MRNTTREDESLQLGSLDAYADLFRVADDAELRDAHFDARTSEILEYEIGDAFGEIFDKTKAFFCEHRADMFHDHPVVDRVRHLSRLEHRTTGRQGDLELNLDRLRGDFLVAVEPDPGLQPKLADENGVQERLPSLNSAAF